MIKYIKLTKYLSGESIEEQIEEAIAKGQVDTETRFFFAKNNCLTTKELASIFHMFDIRRDNDFDSENLVFVPNKYLLGKIKK